MARSPRFWRFLFWTMRYWPPFVGARIRVHATAPDLSSVEVRMPMRMWNSNFVGVHFGGSLYAMTDPFYMLLLMYHLGRGYVVWDKAAVIRFRSPGRELVRAVFELPPARVQQIRDAAASDPKGRHDAVFNIRVETLAGALIAEIEKTVYIKLKKSSDALA